MAAARGLDTWSDKLRPRRRQLPRSRERYAAQGKWLFGELCIADVMYAPVALRFVTYGIPTPDLAQDFVDRVQELESVREWVLLSEEETEHLPFIDELVPAHDGPLTLG